ncbi:MAG: hypothetical protein RJQ09_20825 [Cyclobacteriaceae bacterium]
MKKNITIGVLSVLLVIISIRVQIVGNDMIKNLEACNTMYQDALRDSYDLSNINLELESKIDSLESALKAYQP